MKPTQHFTEMMLKIIYQNDINAKNEFAAAVLDWRLYNEEKTFNSTSATLDEVPSIEGYVPIPAATVQGSFVNPPISDTVKTSITNSSNIAWPPVGIGGGSNPWGVIRSYGVADATATSLWFYLNLTSTVNPPANTEVRISTGTLIPEIG